MNKTNLHHVKSLVDEIMDFHADVNSIQEDWDCGKLDIDVATTALREVCQRYLTATTSKNK